MPGVVPKAHYPGVASLAMHQQGGVCGSDVLLKRLRPQYMLLAVALAVGYSEPLKYMTDITYYRPC